MSEKFTLVAEGEVGLWYVFWDKQTYGEPIFTRDPGIAKRMAPQGAASAARMLNAAGYAVHRQPAWVADNSGGSKVSKEKS